jgi:hypothetical protein
MPRKLQKFKPEEYLKGKNIVCLLASAFTWFQVPLYVIFAVGRKKPSS